VSLSGEGCGENGETCPRAKAPEGARGLRRYKLPESLHVKGKVADGITGHHAIDIGLSSRDWRGRQS